MVETLSGTGHYKTKRFMAARRRNLHSYLWRPLDPHNRWLSCTTPPWLRNTSEHDRSQAHWSLHQHLERDQIGQNRVPLDSRSGITNAYTNRRKKVWHSYLATHERRKHFSPIYIRQSQREQQQYPTTSAFGPTTSHWPLVIDMARINSPENKEFHVDTTLKCYCNQRT